MYLDISYSTKVNILSVFLVYPIYIINLGLLNKLTTLDMGIIGILLVILGIFLFVRAQNKKKDTVKNTLTDGVTDVDYLTQENYYSKEKYIYKGDLPKETEDFIISYKIKGATSGSTEDGIFIHNQIMYYKSHAIAYRAKNGRMYFNIEELGEYSHYIYFCLLRGYQSSEEYTELSEDEIIDFAIQEIRNGPVNQEPPKIVPPKQLLEMPEYNMYLEFLDMLKGKRIEEMFIRYANVVPKNKRNELKLYFEQCIQDGWIYETQGNESVSESFSKKDFVEILKKNNLSLTGNKIDLVERIESNIGLKKFYDTGKVINKLRLTDLGKSKLKEYKSDFDKKHDVFQQNIYDLFLSNEVTEACYNICSFKASYPFDRVSLSTSGASSSSYSFYDELYSETKTCKTVRSSNVLEKIGFTEMYRDDVLSIMCMYLSFHDFDYKTKLEEKYNGFEKLLISSDLIINKDFAYMDFQFLIQGREVREIDKEINTHL